VGVAVVVVREPEVLLGVKVLVAAVEEEFCVFSTLQILVLPRL
jgi:hypothetical protein